MKFTYPKSEKLKRKKHIDLLFTEGKTVSKYPLRLVFVPITDTNVTLEMGVSVSKKYFKKAVDRNYFKRVLRECYRKHQWILKDALPQPYALMFFYQTKERLSYQEIEERTQGLFEKFIKEINKQQSK